MSLHNLGSFQAVTFDLDETLTWSSPHGTALRRWLDIQAASDVAVPAVLRRADIHFLSACKPHDIVLRVHGQRDMPLHLADIEELTRIFNETPVPGAAKLTKTLTDARVPWAIITTATTEWAHDRLGKCRLPLPDVLVAREQLQGGKDGPASFLHAARSLGVRPDRCLAIDDTPLALEGARKAGMATLGVVTIPREYTDNQWLRAGVVDRVLSLEDVVFTEQGTEVAVSATTIANRLFGREN